MNRFTALFKIRQFINAYAAINPEPHFRKKPNNFKQNALKLKRYWPLLLIPLAFWIGNHFGLVINTTESLPQKVWVLHLGQIPKKYDYIAFKPPLKSGLPSNLILHKQVLAVSGDVVTVKKRDFFINGKYIATAKTHSLKNEPLFLGPTGTLTEGQYYVATPHPDSFDSRYEQMGWIDAGHILGVLYPLW
jgi:conjugal transfer pilin signal peptidase TrbI